MLSRHTIAWMTATLSLLTFWGPVPRAHGEPPDPCSLLTAAQVGSVLGVQVSEGHRIVPKLCEWAAPAQPGTSTKKLTVTYETAQGFAYAKMPVGARGITKVPVSGMGDDAVLGTTPKIATTLTVKKGDLYFSVHIWGFPLVQTQDLEKVQAMEKTLAHEILAKL
jgi:hypothetical protein